MGWNYISYWENTWGKKGEHENDFMRVKFNSDDNLPLNKMLKFHILTVIVRSVLEEDGKYYPHIF